MKMFPLLMPGSKERKEWCALGGPLSVPWARVEPYEAQAKANHDQTLERLAERGGLDPMELYAVVFGLPWRQVSSATMTMLRVFEGLKGRGIFDDPEIEELRIRLEQAHDVLISTEKERKRIERELEELGAAMASLSGEVGVAIVAATLEPGEQLARPGDGHRRAAQGRDRPSQEEKDPWTSGLDGLEEAKEEAMKMYYVRRSTGKELEAELKDERMAKYRAEDRVEKLGELLDLAKQRLRLIAETPVRDSTNYARAQDLASAALVDIEVAEKEIE